MYDYELAGPPPLVATGTPFGSLAQRNDVHATDHELDQPRAGQPRRIAVNRR